MRAVSPQAGPAVDISADFTCSGVQPGCCCSSSAAAPATCGVAMLVPSKTANVEPVELAAASRRGSAPPGAETSGFSWWSKSVGPADEKLVIDAAAAGLDLLGSLAALTRIVVRPPCAAR